MKIIRDDLHNIKISEKLSIALGTFDGIHIGHKKIIETAVEDAKKFRIKSAVVTFDKHPLELLSSNKQISIITNNKIKAKILENYGIDYLFFLTFSREFASIEPEKFLYLLINNLNSNIITCGYNYSFGKNGRGNVELLDIFQKEYHYKLNIVDKIMCFEKDVSSTEIRKEFIKGDIEEVNKLLGYNYFLIGTVEYGKGLAKQFGFPTANIIIEENNPLKNGVYISKTYVNNKGYDSISNIGYTPTLRSTSRVLETHIFNFDGNLYGKEIKIEFLKFLREEKKFDSVENLKQAIEIDRSNAIHYFKNSIYK
ncbi:hypothetical protein Q428_09130 [Fervidicella metallireducens AeB]|uniref:Riboflavin biosynthesis protein n=1 Tax=Fervidicella metallireducens AeB TaxID=1403537 RepID=A0A017RTU6_9CLOT|nr:bifunctional riboflavin kinase/FAD synthetase [Fervidicella metallireducens]EYE88183.1 hypothetical protein Q428_09130 [Fervidicella metallireducens AeB]